MTAPSRPGWSRERSAWRRGFGAVAGVDEVGRGALAGPVVAAAVILDPRRCPAGIRDSKLLSAPSRERLSAQIGADAVAWATGESTAREIDSLGILEATRRAMLRALAALPVRPDLVIVDALCLPEAGLPFESPVKADRDVMSVAAASILAKVHRDALMGRLDLVHPGYGLGSHKGYGTRAHFAALRVRGPSPVHRLSFAGLGAAALGEYGAGDGRGGWALPKSSAGP